MAKQLPKGKWVRNSALASHFNVSSMCLWRWKRDPKLACPASYVVNGIEYNDVDEWDAWLRRRAVSVLTEKPNRVERLAKTRKRRQVA